MKTKVLLSLIFVMAFSLSSFTQTVLVVEPDAGVEIGALNNAILANQGNVIYELKRDGVYYINGLISTSFPIHIRAQAGPGKRPILQPAADMNGISTRIFSLGGNAKLEGLYLTCMSDLGNLETNIIRVVAENIRLEITDCFIDYDAQCPIRLQASGTKSFVKDCIIRNIINVNEPNDGKLIDTRGNKTDSICFDNNTIYHTGDLFARIADAYVAYYRFDHNTSYLTGDGFDLNTILEVEITNNIFYNVNWQGSDTTALSSAEAFVKCDSMISMDGHTDSDRTFKITNNNIFIEQKYFDVMSNGKYIAPVFANSICEEFIKTGQMDTTKTLREALIFDNPPPAPMDYITNWHVNNGDLLGKEVPNFYADKDFLNPGGENEYTFNYNKNSKSATASLTRGPLGSSRWTVSFPTSVLNNSLSSNIFSIYPNPANDRLSLNFGESFSSGGELVFYNITGKKVKTFDLGNVSASNEMHLSVSDLPSGIYMYVLQVNNTRKAEGKLMIQK